MGRLRTRIITCIGEYLDLDLAGLNMNRRVYDVFLESLRGGGEGDNLPSQHDGLRPTDYLTLGVSMALEHELGLQLDGDWWSGVLHLGSFLDLETRLRQEMEDQVTISSRRFGSKCLTGVLKDTL